MNCGLLEQEDTIGFYLREVQKQARENDSGGSEENGGLCCSV